MLKWTMKSFKKLSEKEITSNQITKSSQAYLKKWLQIFTLDIFICYTILSKIFFYMFIRFIVIIILSSVLVLG